jgi:hypothetical protein
VESRRQRRGSVGGNLSPLVACPPRALPPVAAQRRSIFLCLVAMVHVAACGSTHSTTTGSGTTAGGNASTTGNTTSSGGGTGSTTGTGGSTSSNGTSTGGNDQWPLVPYGNGGVIASPNLVFMTYADDPNQSDLEKYGVWIADGGYLPLVAEQYGVGNGTVQFVSLTDEPPTSLSILDNPFPAYLDNHFSSDPNMPPYAPNNLYVLMLPADWADASLFCEFSAGFHMYYSSNAGNTPLYAVIANCNSEPVTSIEAVISHEIVEAATDPFTTGWVFGSPTEPWFYLSGELADMCESNSIVYSSGPFIGQLIWSNEAAADGGIPCQPWPASRTYLSILAPTDMASAPPGGEVEIPLLGWASGPFGSFELQTQDLQLTPYDGGFLENFLTNPRLSSQTISNGTTVTLTLSVPSTAKSGQSGAVWVIARDPATGDTIGSAVVGITAQ